MQELAVSESEGQLVDSDAVEIGELYEKARSSIVESVRYQIECGQRLADKKALMKHGEWLPWLKENAGVLGFDSDSTARRLISLYNNTDSNRALAHDIDEAEAVQLSRKTWGHTQPACYSSESVEWYTPKQYIEAARAALGGIDLDPASNEIANETVKAAEFYTQDDNGLEKDWHGSVFLNPPYGRDENYGSLASAFCEKAIAEYESGNADQVIILVNSLHSQNWQANLYQYPICFVDHRIQFVSGTGQKNENPTFQNIFVYLGPDKQKFASVFSCFGYVMERINA